jgi:hypothetical protein
MKRLLTILTVLLAPALLFAQKKPVAPAFPGMPYIKSAELKSDIFDIASDAYRGRRAGTLDELRAAAWVAQKAQEAGLKPAGEDGTWFQFYNIHRTRVDNRSTFTVNGAPLRVFKQVWLTQPVATHIRGQVTWLNSMADTAGDLRGKIVGMKIMAPTPPPLKTTSLWQYRYTALAIRQQSAVLRRKGAAAVVFEADDTTDDLQAFIGFNFESGQYAIDGPVANRGGNGGVAFPTFLVRKGAAETLKQAGAIIKADFDIDRFDYPSVNVVAKVAGTDPKLKNEYVLFSGHHDHDGVGNPVGQDSIWNGADDNASVTVGMLAIGRAFAAKPGKRSALFVWHGAEERGLLGSKWYAAHPTVKKEDIVAVLNGDMIGRNSVDSAALLGSVPPHKNSSALVDAAMKANSDITHFKVDFSWDDPKQPEGWYFRSDHASYAAIGIPSIFFTSLLHPDYHTPKDEPAGIVIEKLTKMTQWMYATGWLVAQAPERPALDKK